MQKTFKNNQNFHQMELATLVLRAGVAEVNIAFKPPWTLNIKIFSFFLNHLASFW
jgi:hypothetical protein